MRTFPNSLFAVALVLALGQALFGAVAPAAPTSGPGRLPRTNLLVHAAPDGKSWIAITNLAGWKQRRAAILAAMQQVMGPLPGPEKRVPLEMQVEEEVDCGRYVRRLIRYTSEPGGRVPAYLLVPKAALTETQRRFPAVLALHQTRPEGQRVVVGLAGSPDDEYGVHLAERGIVVLAPPYTMLANYQPDIRALGWRSGTLKSIWDNMRGLDLLAALPFVKTNRGFGTIGHSLGGHNGVFTAVFDERLTVVVSSCGLDSFFDYYGGDPKVWQPERGWCQLRYMPALTNYAGRLADLPFDFHELIGALAPRRCFISAPLGDSNFRWRSVDAVAAAAGAVYALHGVPGQLEVAHPDCDHRFPPGMREKAYRLLEEGLR